MDITYYSLVFAKNEYNLFLKKHYCQCSNNSKFFWKLVWTRSNISKSGKSQKAKTKVDANGAFTT
jgi:hypothetical protein